MVSIGRVAYEVDARFAKRRVTLRYSPDMTDIFVAEQDGSLTPLRTLSKKENADVKRGKLYLSEGES